MGLKQFRDLLVLLTLCCLSISIHVATSLDTITSSYILKENETLTSSDGMFHLGFFTPTNSTFSYLGIWYISKPTVVWVANRDQPLKDSSGQLKLSEDGNLVVMDGQKEIVWSTKVSNIASNTTIAQLLNTGNLVLQENTTGSETILWESFQHPTNTFLQKMELGTNQLTGERTKLTSWKSPQDPSIGDFSMSLERLNIPEVITWRGNQPYWRSGPWNSQFFLGIPDMNTNYLDGFGLVGANEDNGTYYITYTYANQSVSRIFVLSAEGNFQGIFWDHAQRNWFIHWSALNSECDVYGKCGASGSCDPTSSPICSCLRGYEPRNAEEWNRQNWRSGCVRKQLLQCERVSNGSEAGDKGDGFLKLQNAKVPAFVQWLPSLADDCRTKCLGNCSCIAYAYDDGIGCMLWSGNLTDIQIFSTGGTDLYIRVPYSELDEKKNNATVIIPVTVIAGTIVILICAFILWKRITREGDLSFHCLRDLKIID